MKLSRSPKHSLLLPGPYWPKAISITWLGGTIGKDGPMQKASQLAVENVRDSFGGPFAVLVAQGRKIVPTVTNLVTSLNDPRAHAEIVGIRKTRAELASFVL